MDACGGLPSDTHLLIEACLAKVREDARLDEDPVLPSLSRLRPPPLPVVVVPTPVQLPGPAAIASSAVVRHERKDVPTLRRRRQVAVRWPVFLCAFVASVATGAAFVRSPAAEIPPVRRAIEGAESHVSAAFVATRELVRRPADPR